MLKEIFLQASSPGGGFDMSSLLLIGGVVIIFYFFFIRPQQRKQKDQKKFLEEVKKGDSVVTIGGIHGKIAAVENDTILLEVDRGVKLTLEKSAISLEASKKVGSKN